MANNIIGSEGVKPLSKLINLQILQLSFIIFIENNNIRSKGAKHLSKLINLQKLYLR